HTRFSRDWSSDVCSSDLNPQVFSDKAQVNVTVPIQINTTLDMGDTGAQGTAQFPNIYEMRATVGVEVDTPNGQVVPRKAKRGERSEERRVGKECRSRQAP